MNTRKFCKEKGWGVGTKLIGEGRSGPRRITALGESGVVMRYKGCMEMVIQDFPEDVREYDPENDD